MAWDDAKPRPSQGSHPAPGPFPGELALHELLVVRMLVESGSSLWDAIEHVREHYLTGFAASYVVRSAEALCMQVTWLGTQEELVVLRGAIELAFAESGLSIMPRTADAPARLHEEIERQRDVRLSNTVFKCIARASGKPPPDADDYSVLH
jgi:hypothetical protein